jgi:hypothetical protein
MSKSLKTFPSIAEMVNESVTDTKRLFWRLFRWNLVTWLLSMAGLIFVVLAFIGAYFSEQNIGSTLFTSSVSSPLFGTLVVVSILLLIPLLMIPSFGSFLLIQEEPKKIPYWSLLTRSFAKVLPVILAALMAVPFILGGFLFFIIPGYILALWFSFSTYLVVLKNMGPFASLKRSIAIWQTYGNQIFVRLLGAIAVSIILQNVMQAFISTTENVGLIVVGIILLTVLSTVLQMWTFVFMVKLFLISDQLTPQNTQPKMGRVYLLSAPGLILVVSLVVWGITFLNSDAGKQWAQREFVDEVSEQTDNATPSAEYDFELE